MNSNITICFIGDIMIGRYHDNKSTFHDELESINKTDQLSIIYGNTLQSLQKADLIVANLETAITASNDKYPKTFNYKLDPKYMRTLPIIIF